MRKIFAFLFCTMFVWSAAAQQNKTEPFLPPMDDYKAERSTPYAAPVLKARGMSIDDGYGTLSPYGVASLFGGTPAYEDYRAGMRYGSIGSYLLWSGVGMSGSGLIWMLFAATSRPDGFDFWEAGGAAGLGLLIAGIPLVASGAALTVKAKSRIARAVDIYNDYTRSSYNYSTPDYSAPELSLGFTPGGMGLMFKF